MTHSHRLTWTRLSMLLTLAATAATSFARGADMTLTPLSAHSPFSQALTTYSEERVNRWPEITVAETPCLISPTFSVPPKGELNHHRILIKFTGPGSVEAAILHSSSNDAAVALKNRSSLAPWQKATSGKELSFATGSRGETSAWVLLKITGDVRPTSLQHRCLVSQTTLYGHLARAFNFENGTLRYRMMVPARFDPKKSYPLVISVSGSGGVGNDNARSMEMVILAKYLYTNYLFDPQLECISIVPQIPDDKSIPPGFHPLGQRGAPTPEHPDWPAVNADGWYTQAVLALVKQMIAGLPADPQLKAPIRIDPTRIYFTGFSYGGKALFEFLKADNAPDKQLLAAAMGCSGWSIGPCYAPLTAPLQSALIDEIKTYRRIPVGIFAGGKDGMRFGSAAAYDEMKRQGFTVRYDEFKDTDHVSAAGKTWGNRDTIKWLFAQRKPKSSATSTTKSPATSTTSAKPLSR